MTMSGTTGTARVLVVEDDRVARQLAVEVLRLDGHDTREAGSAEEALSVLEGGDPFDLVLSDVRMGELDGMGLLAELQQRWPELPVILLTAFGDVDGAMAATQAGAWDYLAKPFDIGALRASVGRALERSRLARERAGVPTEMVPPPSSGIIGRSAAMLEVYKLVARVARSTAPVLVLGESGTGKELVARSLHQQSGRASGPFVALSCAALPESLLESELFGHERGAFTGADRQRRGLFEQASGGTLFLDEIGEVSARMQAQLLRVLQEGELRRVGGGEAVKVDVRVVAATHRDLAAEVKAGRFREDLLFRLRVVTLALPPLRERREDIPALASYFLSRAAEREGRPPPALGAEAMRRLQAHDWPGNVRELRNAVERALAVAARDVVLPSDLPDELAALPDAVDESTTAAAHDPLAWDRPTLEVLERRYVQRVLRECAGNKSRASEVLGIDRRTLYRLLDREREEDLSEGDATA